MTDSVRDASTVMVIRDADHGLEVFMVKRHSKMAFMANAYVYPGGKLDPHDTTDEVQSRVRAIDPTDAARILGIDDSARAVGLFLAGVRETFEESGFLLARSTDAPDGTFIDLTRESIADRFQNYRDRLHQNELSLAEVAHTESLVFPLSELAYFAHWITPTFEARRFDTRFFIARAPRNQTPLHDEHETTDSLWISPKEAIERGRGSEFFLAPPTSRTLEQLAEFERVDDVFLFCQGRRPPRILPHLDTSGDEMVLLLPGDPEFPSDDPFYKECEPVDDDVTRLVLREGIWCHA